MFFSLIKFYARLAIRIYCRKIIVNKPEYLKTKGPVLFAANHPNSFLDGMIISTLSKYPVYSLARGDAFRNKKFDKILRRLYLLPIYRSREGAEHLSHNYTTFAACQEVFQKGGSVLIFSEGACVNEWHLRPLPKGTARLAISSWEKGLPVTVIPTGINYSSFRSFGKNMHIHFGNPLPAQTILEGETEGKKLLAFNRELEQQLKGLVYEIDANDKEKLKQVFQVQHAPVKKALLALPALAGFILHAPLYYTIRSIAFKKANNDFYDSVVTALLLLTYPLYLILLAIVAGIFFGWMWAILTLAAAPFCAWACVQLKPQIDS